MPASGMQRIMFCLPSPSNSEACQPRQWKGITSPGEGQVFVPSLNRTTDEVLFIPSLEYNLLSVACLTQEDYSMLFTGTICTVKKNGAICAQVILKDSMYIMLPHDDSQVNV